jgi:nucleotide-binding universal stress UspA family protein
MKHILVATDFSTRSDRAIRRATVLARAYGAATTLLHVVDDDQPERTLNAERRAASALVREQARTLREIDGLDCTPLVTLGDPFAGIIAAAEGIRPDLVVVGPHRRQLLRDVFVGTTAERAIRGSPSPMLMANAVPAGPYRHLLVAVDPSEPSRAALEAATMLAAGAVVTVLHVLDAPGARLVSRTMMSQPNADSYLAAEVERVEGALDEFLRAAAFAPDRRVVRPCAASVAEEICAAAGDLSADLVVIGTRGRSGAARLLLGSVAEEVLGLAAQDVLAVTPDASP